MIIDINNKVKDFLCKSWDGFKLTKLDEIFNRKEPQVSLAILSWLRTEKLLKMLDHWHNNRFIKSNMSLMVQGGKYLPEDIKLKIKKNLNGFDSHNVYYTEANAGTGKPRKEMIYDALKFNTPYIMTTDDDMTFPLGSIEALIYVLELFDDVGAVCMWCEPNVAGHAVVDKKIQRLSLTPPLCRVDIMGSATMCMKREIFEKVIPDENYFVGWGDFDFCMQLKESGWKLLVLAIPDFKAINNYGGPEEYHKFRYKREHSINSANLFYKKWGIRIL